MKKLAFLLVVAITLGCIFPLSSCTKNDRTNIETSAPTKTKQEIELEYALELEEKGAWTGAYCLFDDLVERGYYTEYAEKRDSLYHKYRITELVNTVINYAGLKLKLKDPNSLKIYSVYITSVASKYDSTQYVFEIKVDYGAANSFGGMVRDTYKKTLNHTLAKEYIGRHVDVSFVPLNDIADMDYWEFDRKMEGDFKIYHSNFTKDIPNNIWIEQ